MASGASKLDTNEASSLVIRARDGSADGFEGLFQMYGRRVYNLALRSTRDPSLAEDLCQEVWLRVYRELRSLHEHESFPVWLYRLTSRVCIDAARRRRPQSVIEDDLLPTPDAETPEGRLLVGDELRLAWEALGALPVRQHIALYLRHVEGMSYAEIGAVLDAPVSAVETLLFRARRAFARSLSEIEAEPKKRCRNARAVMAALVDGEASPLQKQMLQAHAAGCADCKAGLATLERAGRAYGALPLAPLPLPLASLVVSTAVPASSGVIAGAGKLAGLLPAHGKLLGAVTVVTTLLAGSIAVIEPEVAGFGGGDRSGTGGRVQAESPGPPAGGATLGGAAGSSAQPGPASGAVQGPQAARVSGDDEATFAAAGSVAPGTAASPDAASPGETEAEAPTLALGDGAVLDETGGLASGVLGGTGDLLTTTTTGATELLTSTLDNLGTVLEEPSIENAETLVSGLTEGTIGLLGDTVSETGGLVEGTTAGIGDTLDAATGGDATAEGEGLLDPVATAVGSLLDPLLPPAPEATPEGEDEEDGSLGGLIDNLLD
jgi:RNA polymerase sigma-70 factor (ECF subfamily)